jgi:hypothetical protein
MRRKPLIRDADDLLGKAIQGNLGESAEEDSGEDSNIATSQAIKQYSNIAVQGDSSKSIEQQSIKATEIETKQDSPIALAQINIRIPVDMNDWLDTQAFKARKKGVSKQSIITQAVREFMERLEGEQ